MGSQLHSLHDQFYQEQHASNTNKCSNFAWLGHEPQEGTSQIADALRRKHLSLATEHAYCAWSARYCEYLAA
jgi:hypothetical protein